MTGKKTYAGAGVDYDALDPFKRMAQEAARGTAGALGRFGFREAEWTRGESVYLLETPDAYLAHVEEGLGTKNLVADAMERLTGRSFYGAIAQDTVAMIVNDMATLGALPLTVAMHLAAGSSDWFRDAARCRDLVEGWKEACILARCAWSGGETPALRGIVAEGTTLLAGSALGIVKPKERLIRGDVAHGDAILLVASSGIHANGLTLARKIAESLPGGYLEPLPDGRTFGEALLDPTLIYVPLVEDCLAAGIEIHYTVNITGHGWRKLMRLPARFAYVIETLPPPLPVFSFLQEKGPVDDAEAYGNFNMGAGFALYVPEHDVPKALEAIARCDSPQKFTALLAGRIESAPERRVVIRPKGIEYAGSTLGVR